MMAQKDEIQFLKNRIKVLERELAELRAYKSNHLSQVDNLKREAEYELSMRRFSKLVV
jgi:predicted RNase H-like nuclease (RuvC/YqgF family)